ncbi:MAG: malate synthase G, partial [Pseudomonadota bacterium]
MSERVEKAGLQWDAALADFVTGEVLPGTNVPEEIFWSAMAALVQAYGPRTKALLTKRKDLQEKIDGWHIEQRGQAHDPAAYEAFLTEIGYLLPEPEQVQVNPQNIDPEIASVCGPQLVVPSTNARFVLNAANARWGSLYDALYGTDALGSPAPKGEYDLQRGAQVVAWAKAHLDEAVPLTKGSWADVATLAPSGGKLMMIAGKGTTELADPSQFAGYNRDEKGNLTDIFFRANNMHIALFIDRNHPVGKSDAAGIADMMLEAAASTIVDLEDSVACVDAADKIVGQIAFFVPVIARKLR